MCQKPDAIRLTNNIFLSEYSDPLIDECLYSFIDKLNDEGIATIACCCGHGCRPPYMTALLHPDKSPKLLEDIKRELGWKNVRGYLDPSPSLFFFTLHPDFDVSNLCMIGVYAYAGYEKKYSNYMRFMHKFY